MSASPSSARIFDEPALLLSRKQVSADTFELAFHSPRIAAAARAGQFVNVLLPSQGFGYEVHESGVPWVTALGAPRPLLLRRPFSVYRAYGSNGSPSPDTIDLLVKLVGAGTRRLCELEPGTELKILGPLGNGFRLPPAGAVALLVAGGCGWASLGMLARELRRLGHATYAFIGAQTAETLPIETSEATAAPHSFVEDLPESCVTSQELESLGVVVALAAEEGGRVYGGLVSDLLEKFLRSRRPSSVHLYACGPWAMLVRVAELARGLQAPCQVSLEERMGCGVGVCNSCVAEVFLADGSVGHKRLCVEGPVLDAAEVNWEQERG
jgi:dihydroorotate dehydrogenase electron transfer subunit